MKGTSTKVCHWLHDGFSVKARVFAIGIGTILVGSMILYGLAVYCEHNILKTAQATRTLQEENQDLQIQLDRVRSYQNVADASAKVQGLSIATDLVDVAQLEERDAKVPKAPLEKAPREIYGY